MNLSDVEISETGMPQLAKALSNLMGDVENVSKDKQGYGYKYADLAQILSEVRPLLQKHGLAVCQLPVSTNDGMVGVHTMLLHEEGGRIGATCYLPLDTQAKMSAAQQAGSVITYARRYSLAAVLGIAQEDDDGAQGRNGQNNIQNPMQNAASGHNSVQNTQRTEQPVAIQFDWPKWADDAIAAMKACKTMLELNKWRAMNTEDLRVLERNDSANNQRVVDAFTAHAHYLSSHPQPAVTTGKEPSPTPAPVSPDPNDEIPF